MKIVNLQTFLTYPANTLFSKYKPCCFDSLAIKGESLLETNDFQVSLDIAGALECAGTDDFYEKLDRALKDGISLKMEFETDGRDGAYDEDQLFSVWEADDIRLLINHLKKCLETAGNAINPVTPPPAQP